MAVLPIAGNYYEILESESPNTLSFNVNGIGTGIITFIVAGDVILDFINDVLGNSRLVNNSFIRREIPASHPLFPFLYASRIVSFKGYSPDGKEDSALLQSLTTYKNIQVRQPPFVNFYTYYKIAVQFDSREYNVMTDAQIDKFRTNETGYLPAVNNVNDYVDEPFDYVDRREYLRYTNFRMQPSSEYLTYGNYGYYVLTQGANGWEYQPLPDQTASAKNILLTKYDLNINWFYVPYEFTKNNLNWTNAYSKVNDRPMFKFNLNDLVAAEGALFSKGTMLLKEVKTKKYEPYYPFETVNINPNSSVFDYFTEYNKNQYCDVTFKFMLWDYPDGVKYIPIATPETYFQLQCKDPNTNWNLVADPKTLIWYYVESQRFPGNKKGRPIYWSYPMQNLWNYVEGA